MSMLRAWRSGGTQVVREAVLTTLFWGLWIYLIMPLVSLLLWFAGYQVFVEQMITLGGYEALLERLTHYGLVVGATMMATLVWVTWNVRRYGHHNIRTHELAAVTTYETAAIAGLEPGELERLHECQRLTVDFDDHDRLMVLECSTGR